jgi:hypothetical protein
VWDGSDPRAFRLVGEPDVLFSDLNEIKGYLEIDPGDHSEDKAIRVRDVLL